MVRGESIDDGGNPNDSKPRATSGLRFGTAREVGRGLRDYTLASVLDGIDEVLGANGIDLAPTELQRQMRTERGEDPDLVAGAAIVDLTIRSAGTQEGQQ